jgi:metal-dependent amidase/aminoacylase/carboxypeptidase family protein
VEIDWRMSTGPVSNDPAICDKVMAAMEGLEVEPFDARLSSEDFAWYLTKAPGLLFRYGSGNEEIGIVDIAHNSNFRVDEEGMRTAIRTFVRFALQYNK